MARFSSKAPHKTRHAQLVKAGSHQRATAYSSDLPYSAGPRARRPKRTSFTQGTSQPLSLGYGSVMGNGGLGSGYWPNFGPSGPIY
jgi:hypothetical protein